MPVILVVGIPDRGRCDLERAARTRQQGLHLRGKGPEQTEQRALSAADLARVVDEKHPHAAAPASAARAAGPARARIRGHDRVRARAAPARPSRAASPRRAAARDRRRHATGSVGSTSSPVSPSSDGVERTGHVGGDHGLAERSSLEVDDAVALARETSPRQAAGHREQRRHAEPSIALHVARGPREGHCVAHTQRQRASCSSSPRSGPSPTITQRTPAEPLSDSGRQRMSTSWPLYGPAGGRPSRTWGARTGAGSDRREVDARAGSQNRGPRQAGASHQVHRVALSPIATSARRIGERRKARPVSDLLRVEVLGAGGPQGPPDQCGGGREDDVAHSTMSGRKRIASSRAAAFRIALRAAPAAGRRGPAGCSARRPRRIRARRGRRT